VNRDSIAKYKGETGMKAEDINIIACIGTGLIGAGWATIYSLRGLPVKLFDTKPEAMDTCISKADADLRMLLNKGIISKKRYTAALKNLLPSGSLKDAVEGVQWIQESAFESYEVKQSLFKEIDQYAGAETIVASSSSGLSIKQIAQYSQYPNRCIIVHPYNPVHLMPLVEVIGATEDSRPYLDTAVEFLKNKVGKEPVILKKEVPGFLSNRLQMAVQREICHLVYKGVATIEDIDKALTFGPGIRWGIMGPMLIMNLGNVNAKAMIAHFGKPTTWLKDMADFKDFPDDWADVLQAGIDEELSHRPAEIGNTNDSIREYRDDMLLKILRLHNKLNF
jgi:3-hydroxyacyl-CoA dehydrogenase